MKLLTNLLTQSQRRLAGISVFSILLAMSVPATHGATLYDEDFSGQAGKGIQGPGGAVPAIQDFTDVDWGINFDGVNMTAASDWFQVRDYDGNLPPVGADLAMTSSDPGGAAFWFSPTIDISGATDLEVAFNTFNTGGFTSGAFTFTYEVDAGGEVTFYDASIDGFGDIMSDITPTGSSLVLRGYFNGSSGAEMIGFDNVLVSGTVVPEPASGALVIAACGLLALRRTKRY